MFNFVMMCALCFMMGKAQGTLSKYGVELGAISILCHPTPLIF
jgi:hypothetical protein